MAEASASASGAIRSAASTIRTWAPKRANICPNSSPTAPPPTTSSERGTSSRSSAETWSSQSISSIPSTGGTAVREPVAIRIRSASSSRSPTRSVCGPVNVACPVMAVKPELFEVAHPLFLRALQRLLPLADAGEVDPRRARLDPEHRRAPVDVVRQLGRDEVGLGRRAGDVGAASAPALALDQRHARVVVAHRHHRRVAGSGAAAEHHQVEAIDHERALSRLRARRYSPGVAVAESQLLEALRAGDEEAFAALVREYHPSLVRVARMYVSTQAAAEEVAQETWLAVLNGLDRFEGRSSLKTWIFRILTNIAKTKAVRDGRTLPFSALQDPGRVPEAAVDADRFLDPEHPRWPGHWVVKPVAWPEEALVAAETRERLAEAIEALPATQRAVISLRDIEGWSSEEVRNALDLSETNQRVLLHRARAKVREALDSYLEQA